MAILITSSKCGHCGANWNISIGANSNIGPPVIKCKSCNGLNKTNMYLYRQANLFGKIWFWITQSLGGFYMIIPIGIIYAQFVTTSETVYDRWGDVVEIKEIPPDPNAFLIGFALVLAAVIFYLFIPLDSLKFIKELERRFDENGAKAYVTESSKDYDGFLWSDEWN